MKDLGTFKAAIFLLAVSAAGCGMQGGAPTAAPVSSSSVTREAVAPLGGTHKDFAGTYNGSIDWSRGGQTYSGTLETVLRFHYKNILGPFKVTENGKTYPFRLYGRIKSKTDGQATIVFLIYNTKGNYATGNGTIANGTFDGKASTSAVGGDQSASLNFSVTKNQK